MPELETRAFDDVRHSDELVRQYRTPPGDRLYAYRSDDGEHHVVVSRGDEPRTRWEQRVPAERDRVVPGQKLWTIPDNWDKRVVSKRDNISYGLFYIPETDVWAKVSIPTNDWLVDAWYGIKSVGELTVEPDGDLGNRLDVRDLADKCEGDGADLIRAIKNNWDAVEEDLRHALEWVREDGIEQMTHDDQPIPTDRGWHIEFQERISRPGDAIKRQVDLSDYDVPLSVILEDLRDAGLLPSHYRFKLVIDDTDIDMEFWVRGLAEAGASPAEAVDYYMVEVEDRTQTEWAKERGVDQSTVSGNVRQAKQRIK